VTVYGAIRSYTEENGDCIRPPCIKTVNDRFLLRISPYGSVYDTEITLKKKGILLLSETLLGFPNGSETPKKVFEWLGNPKRVSDSNKIPFFLE
jgi:hypothetical protein